MLRNVEIKAKIKNLEDIVSKAKQLSKSESEVIKQDDIFFKVPQGRLKLRTYEDKTADLIYYNRPDSDGPKLSEYEICKFAEGSQISSLLSQALGIKGRVKKIRHLFMVGRTRVHIDHVEGLGNYMELEGIKILQNKVLYMPFTDMPHYDMTTSGMILESSNINKQVVLSEDQTLEQGQEIAEKLMIDLGVEKSDLISGAYMDLLLK